MLTSVKQFLQRQILNDADSESITDEEALKLATASLMVEMARADFDQQAGEINLIKAMLASHFSMTSQQVAGLLAAAERSLEDASCLHQFTRQLHGALAYDEKLRVVQMLWQVAYADQVVDKYEEYLVRKVSALLYVSDRDVVRLKHRAAEAAGRKSP